MDSLLAVDAGGSFFFFSGLPVQSLLMLSLLSQRQGTPFPLRGQPNTLDPVSSFLKPLPSHCIVVIMHCASRLLPISQGLALFLGVACLSSNTRTRPRPALSDCPRESDIRRTDIITSLASAGINSGSSGLVIVRSAMCYHSVPRTEARRLRLFARPVKRASYQDTIGQELRIGNDAASSTQCLAVGMWFAGPAPPCPRRGVVELTGLLSACSSLSPSNPASFDFIVFLQISV